MKKTVLNVPMVGAYITTVIALLIFSSPTVLSGPAITKVCAADIKQLCSGVIPGGGQVKLCIKGRFTDLSKQCQALVLTAAAARKDCATDVKRNCANVRPGAGRIEACMKSHLADLSEPCIETLGRTIAGSL